MNTMPGINAMKNWQFCALVFLLLKIMALCEKSTFDATLDNVFALFFLCGLFWGSFKGK